MWKQKLFAAIAAALLLWALPVGVRAHSVPDMNRKGRITVTLRDGSAPVSGGSLTWFRVGDVAEDDGNYSFALSGDFSGSGVSLEDIESHAVAGALADYAKKQKLAGTTVSISAGGQAAISNLQPGLYLLTQREAAKGYAPLNPFLVSLPSYEDGVYRYEVDASPKVSLERAPEEPTETTRPTIPLKDDELPQTGVLNWPVPVMAVAGLMLICLGFCLCRGKRMEGNAE